MRFTSKAFYVARLYGVSSPSLRVFMKLSADNLLVFQMIAGSCSIFLYFTRNKTYYEPHY